ncbi:unnamed protein product, partial [Brachionus calyciflorus]
MFGLVERGVDGKAYIEEFTLENIVLSEDEVSILSINEGENENISDLDDTEDQNDSLDGTWSSR